MKTVWGIVWVCCLWVCALEAAPASYGDLRVTTIVSVYDGDTFKVTIEGIHPLIGEKVLVRILGVDTPEIRSHNPLEKVAAEKAKIFVSNRLQGACEIILKNVMRDKYFRILADVYVDGVRLADELIALGLGYPYDGGTKQSWEADPILVN